MAMAFGAARRIASGRNRVCTGRESGRKDRKKDGYPSIIRSISVIWMGTKGNGVLVSRQMAQSRTEYSVLMKRRPQIV